MSKHPAGIAQDKYFAMKEGNNMLDMYTLGGRPGYAQFLENRLHSAFQAGYDAAVKDKQKEIDTLAKKFADMMVYANQLEMKLSK